MEYYIHYFFVNIIYIKSAVCERIWKFQPIIHHGKSTILISSKREKKWHMLRRENLLQKHHVK